MEERKEGGRGKGYRGKKKKRKKGKKSVAAWVNRSNLATGEPPACLSPMCFVINKISAFYPN